MRMHSRVHDKSALILCTMILAISGCGGTVSTNKPAANPAATGTVSVTCTPSTIGANGLLQCTANIQGSTASNPVFTWAASAGPINSTGLFTAPAIPGGITITATSTADQTKSGQAIVTVASTPVSRHVVMVMEENQSYATVVGNTAAWPNLNSLIAGGALATNYYANVHPSIGNYFMLTTGQILTTDDNSTTVWNVDNIARRMLSANVTFKVYAEGITKGYLGGNTGLYVIRHNPFALLSDIASNLAVANAVIYPFTQFATDLANNALPEFSFIIPNLDDDAHSGTPQQADNWLQSNIVTPLSANGAFRTGGDGLLIVDFDEALDTDIMNGGGQVACILWGPIVKPAFKQASVTVYQHQSMLRTGMEALKLPNPPAAAAAAPSMAEFFNQQ